MASEGNGKTVLIVLGVLLAISLIGNGVLLYQRYGTSEGGSEGQIADLQNQIATLQNEKTALQNEIDNLKAAKLVTRLGASDNRPFLGDKSLFIEGSIWNVGTNPAHNCRLHVVLYQGQTIAEDTYITLGTINGQSYTDISENVYYDGEALSDYTIDPEWE